MLIGIYLVLFLITGVLSKLLWTAWRIRCFQLKKNKTALGIWHFKAKYYFKIMHYCNVWWGNNDSGGTNSTWF